MVDQFEQGVAGAWMPKFGKNLQAQTSASDIGGIVSQRLWQMADERE